MKQIFHSANCVIYSYQFGIIRMHLKFLYVIKHRYDLLDELNSCFFMLIKLCTSLISINLVVSKQLSTIIIYMHNFVTKFGKILEICKKFTGNQVNETGIVP